MKCMCTHTQMHARTEAYLITVLLIVQLVGVARGGVKESKTVSFRERERGQAENQSRRYREGEHEHSTR